MTLTVEESEERPKVVVEKRELGKPFDSMSCKTGQFRLKQGGLVLLI